MNLEYRTHHLLKKILHLKERMRAKVKN